MQCDAFDRQLDDLLDRRLSPGSDASLRKHGETCPRCAAVLRAHGQLERLVPRLELSEPVSAMSSGHRWGWAAGWPAVAAALLAAITFWASRQAHEEIASDPPTQLLAEVEQRRQEPSKGTETGPAILPAASGLALHQPLFGLQLLSQADWSATFASVSTDLEVPRMQTKWINVVSHEMAPVQKSMSSAVNVLRRSLDPAPRNDEAIDG